MGFKLCDTCGAVMTEKAEVCPVCGGSKTAPLRISRGEEPAPEGKKRIRLDLRGLTVLVAVLLVLILAALPFLMPKLEAAASDPEAQRAMHQYSERLQLP